MDFKLIIALVSDERTEKMIKAAREAGATGATVITSGRGEGLHSNKTFFGLTLEGQTDMVLFIVEQHMSRAVLEKVAEAGKFDIKSGGGVVMQLNIEDVIGLKSQYDFISKEIEDQL